MFYKNLKIKDENNIYIFSFNQKNLLTKNLSVDKINNVKNISWLLLENKIIQKNLNITNNYSDALMVSKIVTNNLVIDRGLADNLSIKANEYIMPESLTTNSLFCKKINKIIIENSSTDDSSYKNLNFTINKLYYSSNNNIYKFYQHLEFRSSYSIKLEYGRFYRIEIYEEKKSDQTTKRKMLSFVGGVEGPKINLTSKWEVNFPDYETPVIISFNILQEGKNLSFSSKGSIEGSTTENVSNYYNNNYWFLIKIYLIQIF
jgi:hypothetical protein